MTEDREMEAALGEVGAMLNARIGMRPEPSLRGRLLRGIREEVNGRGDDLGAYLEALSRSTDMVQGLVNRVTVQESGFFRHPDHFDVLAEHVLAAVAQPVTIWSAACANGQEAYSLAMLLIEQGIRGSVIATDLSTAALGRTVSGTYNIREIAGLSSARRDRFLVACGDGKWQVSSEVRSRVTTFRHNLVTSLPDHVGGCQIVFCRNVLIYFSPEHARHLLSQLASSLPPGAFLFLGGAESLWQVSDRFRAVRLGNSFVYQPCGAAESAPAQVVRARPGATSPVAERRRSPDPAPPLPVRESADDSRPSPAAVLAADAGQDALAEGDHTAAVIAFRKWCYLAPDDPVAALHLGLALEAGGHELAARRAYAVSRSVLHRVGPQAAEAALGGYAPEELVRLLDIKQGNGG